LVPIAALLTLPGKYGQAVGDDTMAEIKDDLLFMHVREGDSHET